MDKFCNVKILFYDKKKYKYKTIKITFVFISVKILLPLAVSVIDFDIYFIAQLFQMIKICKQNKDDDGFSCLDFTIDNYFLQLNNQ